MFVSVLHFILAATDIVYEAVAKVLKAYIKKHVYCKRIKASDHASGHIPVSNQP